jgi:hypothetical protein
MATRAEHNFASAVFTTGVRGSTRSSNLGRCDGTSRGGGEGRRYDATGIHLA